MKRKFDKVTNIYADLANDNEDEKKMYKKFLEKNRKSLDRSFEEEQAGMKDKDPGQIDQFNKMMSFKDMMKQIDKLK